MSTEWSWDSIGSTAEPTTVAELEITGDMPTTNYEPTTTTTSTETVVGETAIEVQNTGDMPTTNSEPTTTTTSTETVVGETATEEQNTGDMPTTDHETTTINTSTETVVGETATETATEGESCTQSVTGSCTSAPSTGAGEPTLAENSTQPYTQPATNNSFVEEVTRNVTQEKFSRNFTDEPTIAQDEATTREHHQDVYRTNATESLIASTDIPLLSNVSEAVTSESSGTGRFQCDLTTIGIISGASAGVLLLVLVASVVCFCRYRNRWRTKAETEQSKTDIWSMSTFNNTIVNENFSDFELAKPDPRKSSTTSKSVGVISPTQVFDPFARQLSQEQPRKEPPDRFNSEVVNVIRRSDSLRRDLSLTEVSKLRRNTYSAPDGLGIFKKSAVAKGLESTAPDVAEIPRDRSLTFTAGKKLKVDRHVLLRHEEIVEDDLLEKLGDAQAKPQTSPAHTYYVTEL